MINVTTNNELNKKSSKPYPKLMKCVGESWAKGAIVLFTCSGTGVQLSQAVDGDQSFPSTSDGGYSDCWDMLNFIDYNEPITLQNA